MHPHRPPPLENFSLVDRDDERVTFTGRHLGHGSSARPERARWFEVDIYVTEHGGEWIIHTRGMSSLPDDHTKVRIVRTSSAFEILEILTVRHNDRMFIPRPSSRALAQAAQWDDDIRDAYINRAVA